MRAADERDIGVAYIYCDYAEVEDQTAENIIACLAKQLSLRKTTIPGQAQKLYEQYDRGSTRPDLNKLPEILRKLCIGFRQVFFVLDALDECEEKNRKSLLAQLEKVDHPTARFFLTSRPHV